MAYIYMIKRISDIYFIVNLFTNPIQYEKSIYPNFDHPG